MIKCHYTPGDNDFGSYEIDLLYNGGGSPEECLVWKDKLLKALDGQSISTGPQRYMFTERILTADAKAAINLAALDIDIPTVDNFNKVLWGMTIHAYLRYAYYASQINDIKFLKIKRINGPL